ncbi:MAG TPA: 5-formyltetrahydrofolate cyclo-ligase [Pseudobacteroides sp.]|uniref:5-formyltetrahydrofolate cyclo-ligase n=1 Tax=Pseudobacteroides sp. TaxID=1968840 RepID=UPI002F9379D3
MDQNKEILRRDVLKIRNCIEEEERIEKSRRIFNTLIGLNEFKNSASVMCYIDFKGEVITRDIIDLCFSLNKKLCVPVISNNQNGARQIIASVLKDPESELYRGNFGIMEPKDEYIRVFEPVEIDLVIVPGVVFDEKRNRIGFGAGFYDRFLKKVRNDCFKIGLAYEFQVVKSVPADKFDIPMDLIITEKRRI